MYTYRHDCFLWLTVVAKVDRKDVSCLVVKMALVDLLPSNVYLRPSLL